MHKKGIWIKSVYGISIIHLDEISKNVKFQKKEREKGKKKRRQKKRRKGGGWVGAIDGK